MSDVDSDLFNKSIYDRYEETIVYLSLKNVYRYLSTENVLPKIYEPVLV